MLDASAMRYDDAPLVATINRELKKRKGGPERAVSLLQPLFALGRVLNGLFCSVEVSGERACKDDLRVRECTSRQ